MAVRVGQFILTIVCLRRDLHLLYGFSKSAEGIQSATKAKFTFRIKTQLNSVVILKGL